RIWATRSRSEFRRASTEPVERRLDELRQRPQVVPTLEHGGDAWRELPCTPCEFAKPRSRHPHPGERVVDVRVEACRDEEEVGLELRDGTLDRRPSLEIPVVACA